jgi:hypothetical protein
MTLKERLDKRIVEIYIAEFGQSYTMSMIALKVKTSKAVTFSMALLKLLLFLSQNVFKEGKLNLPFWKWPSIINAIKEFLNSI